MRFLIFFISALALGPGIFAADVEWVSDPRDFPAHVKASDHRPTVSADGTFIVYESLPFNNDLGDSFPRGLFWVDVKNKTRGEIKGDNRPGFYGGGFVSTSGRDIAFHYYSTSIVSGILVYNRKENKKNLPNPPRFSDIFVYDRRAGIFHPITRGLEGRAHEGEALYPRVDKTGRFVLFTSNATNLIPGLSVGTRQVTLYDRLDDVFQLISRSTEGAPGNRLSAEPRMSRQARFIAYRSQATNLAPGVAPESLVTHLYLWDRQKGTTTRVNAVEKGFDAQDRSGRFDMDERGDYLVFEGLKRSSSSWENAPEAGDLFWFDRRQDRVQCLTRGFYPGQAYSPTISGDGRFVAFLVQESSGASTGVGLAIHDRRTNQWKKVFSSERIANPALSKDGTVVVFEAAPPDGGGTPGAAGTLIGLVKNPLIK
ncbi:MAG: hypothetical protein LHV69_03860 [Elusimicrobia bacterium]|nr:hypothetical protein [Candidatus Obscuribacterium magneticum]